jgi:UDP-N-acetylmuramyl pentapeptide synthase
LFSFTASWNLGSRKSSLNSSPEKVEQIISDLKLSPEDIVFIKGSRGIALDKLVSALE